MERPAVTPQRLGAAVEMERERLGGELLTRIQATGVRTILLKGAAVRNALYEPGEARPARDVDLLVSSDDLDAAREALREAGLEDPLAGAAASERAPHAESWKWTAHDLALDLHWSLFGVAAAPEVVWRELSAHTAPIGLGQTRVEAVAGPSLATVLAVL
jgi:hypothetical protein